MQGLSFPDIQTVQLGANYSWLSCYVYTHSAQLVGVQGPSQDKDITIRKLFYIFLSRDQTRHNNQPVWHKTVKYQGKKGFC
jgi:hypothetical protein